MRSCGKQLKIFPCINSSKYSPTYSTQNSFNFQISQPSVLADSSVPCQILNWNKYIDIYSELVWDARMQTIQNIKPNFSLQHNFSVLHNYYRRSRYGDCLRAGWSGNRIPVEGSFSAPVQTGSEAHPASCTMGTGSFPRVRCGRGVTLTSHPLLMSRSKIG